MPRWTEEHWDTIMESKYKVVDTNSLKEYEPTNADRIRSMSDKELAEFLCEISKCEFGYCPAYDICMKTEHGTMEKWLQSEAES